MVLAEISLAIAAVKSVGGAIDSAKTLMEISGQLDKAFSLTSQVEDTTPNKPKGQTQARIEQNLEKFEDNTDGQSTSFAAIAQEVTDAKALKMALYTLKIKLNNKWGPDTYDTIIKLREERLERAAKARSAFAQRQREIKKKRKHFFFEMLKAIGLIIAVSGMFWWLMQNY